MGDPLAPPDVPSTLFHQAPPAVGQRGPGGHLWPIRYDLQVSRIERIEVGPWWPGITLEYRGPNASETYSFGMQPWPGIEPDDSLKREGAVLSGIVEWAQGRGIPVVGGGWLGAPEVAFERLKRMPEPEAVAEVAGYRESARVEPWYRTEPLGVHEHLLRWMVRRLDRHWPIPEEVRVHRDTVFVGRLEWQYRALSIPLSSLRARRDWGVDAIYVFGRYAQLPMLGRREGCPVRARFDEVLAQRGA